MVEGIEFDRSYGPYNFTLKFRGPDYCTKCEELPLIEATSRLKDMLGNEEGETYYLDGNINDKESVNHGWYRTSIGKLHSGIVDELLNSNCYEPEIIDANNVICLETVSLDQG